MAQEIIPNSEHTHPQFLIDTGLPFKPAVRIDKPIITEAVALSMMGDWHHSFGRSMADRARAWLTREDELTIETNTYEKLDDAVQGFFEAMQLPAGTREEGRTLIDEAVALHSRELLGDYYDPYIDEAIARVKKLVFPEVVEDTFPPKHALEVVLTPAEYGYNVMAGGSHKDDIGLAEAMIVVVRDIIPKNPRLRQILATKLDEKTVNNKASALQRQNPFFQTLLSFDTDLHKVDDRLLTEYEKQVRLGQAEDLVRRKHGLFPSESLRINSNATRDYGKFLLQLDDETVKTAEFPAGQIEQQKFERARAFFCQHLGVEQQDIMDNFVSKMQSADPKNGRRILDIWKNEIVNEITRQIFGDSPARDLQVVTWPVRRMIDEMKNRFSRAPIRSIDPSKSYREYLDEASSQLIPAKHTYYAQVIAQRMSDYFKADSSWNPSIFIHRNSDALYSTRGTQDTSGSLLGKGCIMPQGECSRGSDYVDIDSHEKKDLGTIFKYDLPLGIRDAKRFITPGSHNKQRKDVSAENADVILVLADSDQGAVRLGGFTTEGLINSSSVYLNYDKEAHDPDDYCFVPVDAARLDDVVVRLNGSGLHSLADALTNARPRTVAELEVVVSSRMRYTTQPRASVKLEDLSDCTKLIGKDGLLEVQCTGANTVLEMVIGELYGIGKTKLVGGTAISSMSKTIPVVGHLKVAFAYDSKLYYLDATPSPQLGHSGESPAPNTIEYLRKIELGRRPKRQNIEKSQPSLSSKESSANTEVSQQEVLENIFENEVMKLAEAWTGLPKGSNDELNGYRQMNGRWGWYVSQRERILQAVQQRGQDDLLWQTIGLVGGSASGKIDKETLDQNIDYFKRLQSMPLSERQEFGGKAGIKMALYNEASIGLMLQILQKTRNTLSIPAK